MHNFSVNSLLSKTAVSLAVSFALLSSFSPVAEANWWKNVIKGFQNVGKAVEKPFAKSLGESVKQQMVQEHGIWNNSFQINRVNHIGNLIAAESSRKDVDYNFTVLDWDVVNAFAAPAGQVFVTRGLLETADDNELAGVMAHEIGHVTENHAMKAVERNIGFMVLMNYFLKDNQLSERQWATLGSTLLQLKFSREAEFEADARAVDYSYRAGYNPRGLVSFFEKLEQNHESGGPAFMEGLNRITSTHPPTSERINKVWERIDVNSYQ